MRLLTFASTLAVLLISSAIQAQEKRPNILFMLSDDQRPDTIAAWGNPHIRTPHLDQLVAEGFSFRRNYCMGSPHGAVCVPSRAMMMTGQPYFRIPMDLRGVSTLPEVLGAAGYQTFITGKWHNQTPALLRSFQRGKAVFLGGMSNHMKVPLIDFESSTVANERIGNGFSSEIFANAAVEFLSGHDQDKPFFAYVSFSAPHDPRTPPEPYRKEYYANRPPLPPNFMPQHPFDNGRLITRDEILLGWPRTEEAVRDQLAEYYGMITHMDEQIGRILEALSRSGAAGNTIVVFAADHGLAVGSHGLLGKQNVYEHSMGAPLIFRGPGIPKGKSSEALTYLLDIVPTLLARAGLEDALEVDGFDLATLWNGERASVRDSILLAYEDTQRALVTDRWKLIRYPKIGRVQLFDLRADPFEMRNLARRAAHSDLVDQMTFDLMRWQARVGDTVPLGQIRDRGGTVDLTGTPRIPDRHQPDWVVEKYFETESVNP